MKLWEAERLSTSGNLLNNETSWERLSQDSINNCYSFIFCRGDLSVPYEFQHEFEKTRTRTSLESALEIIEQETSWESAFSSESI